MNPDAFDSPNTIAKTATAATAAAVAAAIPAASGIVRLSVPRHLQDCNGYCGPACVMMVHSGAATSSATEAQHELFRRVRAHAQQSNDRRPVKSPAESLLTLLAVPGQAWEKIFAPEPLPVASRIIHAVAETAQPCLLLVSKGMHWVVAFGRTQHEDGTVAGVLVRDPAWAGMPSFFGLTILPEKPTFQHTAVAPCPCLTSDNPPGSVHERYLAMAELLSPRGLQGSPDWEGRGALALVPVVTDEAAILTLSPPAYAAPLAGLTAQQAALLEARAHGLCGQPDSPADWQAVLADGQPGPPIFVKDPEDARDDYWLVPISSQNPALRRTAWIMLDPVTLRLREASLLDHWLVPAFPTQEDANILTSQAMVLPDGMRHRFKNTELKPNQKNLVWQASAASILPYWPVKEFLAAHPNTGEPISLYLTQEGKPYSALSPDEPPSAHAPVSPLKAADTSTQSPTSPWKKRLLGAAAILGIAGATAAGLTHFSPDPRPARPSAPVVEKVKDSSPVRSLEDAEPVTRPAKVTPAAQPVPDRPRLVDPVPAKPVEPAVPTTPPAEIMAPNVTVPDKRVRRLPKGPTLPAKVTPAAQPVPDRPRPGDPVPAKPVESAVPTMPPAEIMAPNVTVPDKRVRRLPKGPNELIEELRRQVPAPIEPIPPPTR